LLHLLAGVAIEFRVNLSPPSGPPPVRVVQPGESSQTMRVYDIVVAEGAVAPIEAQVQAFRDARPSFVAPIGQPGVVRAPPVAGERRDIDPVGERLRPRLGHTQVWTDPDPLVDPDDPNVRVQRRVASTLRQYNDSVAAELERETRATDWTVRDGSGGRWGVSPGQVHLGDRSIPLNIAFTTPGWRDEASGTSRSVQWSELQQQANREMVREMFAERVKLIRARQAAERDSTRTPGGS
jgi:hypothetical protein